MFYYKVLLLLALTTDVFGYSVRESQQVGIIGGQSVPISEVPYMADLRTSNGELNDGVHLCGGTILHKRFILTAAHCCIEPNTTFIVAVGTDNVHKGDMYDVEKLIPHQKYSIETVSEYDYDICLVKLKKEIAFRANVTKVELADKDLTLKSGMVLKATGWGFMRPFGNQSDILRQVSLPFVDQSQCEKIYEDMTNITERMICAGVNGKGVCHYDSGGPLTLNNVQVGITSFGKMCSYYPAVFVNITALLSWISDTIAKNI